MPIRTEPTCKHCGVAIEPLNPADPWSSWIHSGLSIWCPGSGDRFLAHPIITVVPLGQDS